MQRLHKDVQAAEQPQEASAHSHGRTAVLLPRLRQEIHAEQRPAVTYANPYGREAVCLRHMSEAVQQDELPQVAQAKAAHQRGALQVRRLPEEVRQRQQTAQTLGDVQMPAQQHRGVLTYRFERLRCRR